MEKPVIISIRGVQSPFPGHEDVMELVTQGTLSGTEDEGLALTYEESELTGLEGTTTTFRILKDRITLLREGTLNSEMIFQEGRRHISLYQTPFGGFSLGVRTHSAKAEMSLVPPAHGQAVVGGAAHPQQQGQGKGEHKPSAAQDQPTT